ncbi:MAG: hypothetical protein BWY06_02089 [Candidatus Latescibacteria bacterium ADurb.Bin168]|nr:MAG: hypothetical protein BWY06_02089 [Candidatus Latescibacteria bacterium ADurb.Bin168]
MDCWRLLDSRLRGNDDYPPCVRGGNAAPRARGMTDLRGVAVPSTRAAPGAAGSSCPPGRGAVIPVCLDAASLHGCHAVILNGAVDGEAMNLPPNAPAQRHIPGGVYRDGR